MDESFSLEDSNDELVEEILRDIDQTTFYERFKKLYFNEIVKISLFVFLTFALSLIFCFLFIQEQECTILESKSVKVLNSFDEKYQVSVKLDENCTQSFEVIYNRNSSLLFQKNQTIECYTFGSAYNEYQDICVPFELFKIDAIQSILLYFWTMSILITLVYQIYKLLLNHEFFGAKKSL